RPSLPRRKARRSPGNTDSNHECGFLIEHQQPHRNARVIGRDSEAVLKRASAYCVLGTRPENGDCSVIERVILEWFDRYVRREAIPFVVPVEPQDDLPQDAIDTLCVECSGSDSARKVGPATFRRQVDDASGQHLAEPRTLAKAASDDLFLPQSSPIHRPRALSPNQRTEVLIVELR